LVLRASLAKTGGYEVDGECYVHGYMGAEALFGPVPRPYERASRSVELIQICEKVSKISETGEALEDDTGLELLTNGWHLDSVSRWLVNDETGEGSSHDPRLAPEALEKPGVFLDEFNLV